MDTVFIFIGVKPSFDLYNKCIDKIEMLNPQVRCVSKIISVSMCKSP